MCGIIGIVGHRDVVPRLLGGLRCLEYRGYDSAGLAVVGGADLRCVRASGKVARLAERLAADPVPGRVGIAHTRWATHGAPSERNAHPVTTSHVALVHNGIIENHRALRAELEAAGEVFATDTDTEVAAVILTRALRAGASPEDAMAHMLTRVAGAFAFAVLFAGHDGLMICARHGSPLAIGYGDGEAFVGSDGVVLAPLTDRVSYLEDGDMAVLRGSGIRIRDSAGRPAIREMHKVSTVDAAPGKGGYHHFMQKEIFEQPGVVERLLDAMVDRTAGRISLPALPAGMTGAARTVAVACGTSLHAGLIARSWFDAVTATPMDVELASEFRYRLRRIPDDHVVIGISQSGETADTLAALRFAATQGARTLGIVNRRESTIARTCDASLWTQAGPEIGVASTKAFTAQLFVLACLALHTGRAQHVIERDTERRLVAELAALPCLLEEALAGEEAIRRVAADIVGARNALYLGRGTSYPVALEGALKLKELSYIHAEGYAAGEMKHGPIALVERDLPVVVVAPPDHLFDKTISNMQEVLARGARVILVSTRAGIERAGPGPDAAIAIPDCGQLAAPIALAVPMQLLAYHAAVLKNTDVDQPRNLAKSVTVE